MLDSNVVCFYCQKHFNYSDPDRLFKNNGTCWDDEFYCDQCIDDNLCGCKKVLRKSGQLDD